MTGPDFAGTRTYGAPFPHFRVPSLLSEPAATAMLDWLDTKAPWKLRIADFYEQHEFSMLSCEPPEAVATVVSGVYVDAISRELAQRLDAPPLQIVDICLHRLVEGQTIRIHNDHIGSDETHRLVVQLNRGWTVEKGGLFMLFGRDDPESVADVMLPKHRSAFGFEISPRSYHAVSTIRAGHRDTLVYTFRRA